MTLSEADLERLLTIFGWPASAERGPDTIVHVRGDEIWWADAPGQQSRIGQVSALRGLEPEDAAWARETLGLECACECACECGETSGVACDWRGPKSQTVLVEWMPPHLRDSHATAGNSGVYPHNGARRLRVSLLCVDGLVDCDPEWATEVTP